MKVRIVDIMRDRMIRSSKVASDLFTIQFKWSLWYVAVIVLMHILVSFISESGIFAVSYGASPTYMLVIGIVVGNFLPFYVKNGVTRKDYFIGVTLAALGLSFALAIVFSILSSFESLIYSYLNLGIIIEPFKLQLNIDGSNNWLVSVLIYSLNIYVFYLIGWFIHLGLYRYKWMTGIGFCVSAFIFAFLQRSLWNDQLFSIFAIENAYMASNFSIFIAIMGTIVLIGIILCLIRLFTKKIPIKI